MQQVTSEPEKVGAGSVGQDLGKKWLLIDDPADCFVIAVRGATRGSWVSTMQPLSPRSATGLLPAACLYA